MAVNKVIYNAEVLLDLTSDTVTPEALAEGVTAHDKSGNEITGAFTLQNELSDQDSLIDQIKQALVGKTAGGGGGGADGGADVARGIVDRTIEEYIDNECASVGHSALRGCTKLKTLDLPKATSVADYAFYQCSALTTLNLPSVTSIGQQIIYGCNKLTGIVLPSLTTASTNALREAQYVETIDLPKLTNIPTQMFLGCRGLKALILRSSTMVTLANTNAFSTCYRMLGTKNSGFNPNGERLGFVYVPRVLVGEYQADATWTTSLETTQFRAIEDYPDICG